jgi:hypothetical protein
MSGATQSIDDSRLLVMPFVSLGMAFAAFLRVLISHTNLFLVAMAALWGFEYGMLTTREAKVQLGGFVKSKVRLDRPESLCANRRRCSSSPLR